jgi:hypothetical protein
MREINKFTDIKTVYPSTKSNSSRPCLDRLPQCSSAHLIFSPVDLTFATDHSCIVLGSFVPPEQ